MVRTAATALAISGTLLAGCATPSATDTPIPAEATPPVGETANPEAEPAPQQPGDWQSNLNVLLGMRFLDEDIWDPLDDQPAVGLEFDMRPRGSVLGFEAGMLGAYDWDSVGVFDLESWTFELYAGPRLTWALRGSTVFPFVAGGLSWFYSDFETVVFSTRVTDHDNSLAGYAHAGVYVKTGGSTNVGVDVRGLFGSDLELFGADADGDYWQVALILGGGW